jgi:hypothetical protein
MDEIFRVLTGLSQPRIDSTGKISVTIPSDLYNVLYSAIRGRKLEEREFEVAEEIFSQWLPFYDRYHVKLIVKQLFSDPHYLEILKRFFESFRPTNGLEYIKNQDKIGEETVYLRNLVEKFGAVIGRVVFELLALSHKLRGMIISFGQRLATMLRKTKMTVVMVHSAFKEKMKQHSRIRSALRISLYAISTESLRKLVNDLQIYGLDLNLAVDIAGLGIFVVADG